MLLPIVQLQDMGEIGSKPSTDSFKRHTALNGHTRQLGTEELYAMGRMNKYPELPFSFML